MCMHALIQVILCGLVWLQGPVQAGSPFHPFVAAFLKSEFSHELQC